MSEEMNEKMHYGNCLKKLSGFKMVWKVFVKPEISGGGISG